ncbi:uncharacterized protein LOC143063912 [Mytilus galloprovincialis]|uniref:uncharacterized protein LOC143063912 n=1 Tax=Mytilus galloprovincialis TaxID=29158 RepID=UPI003F7C8A04
MTKDDEANQGQGMPPQDGDPSTSAMVPMPAPALPEYIEHAMPPPSYEEIMGHQTQTSVQQTVAELPPLAYVDIMPRLLKNGNIKYKIAPEFDKFSFVIEAANQWLRSNPGFAVWKCETVERKVDAARAAGQPPIIEMEKMTIHHSTFGFNVFIRGIRMWLVKKTGQGPQQQLGLMNVVPEKKIIEWQSVRSGGLFMMEDPIYRNTITRTQSFVTYDGLMETIAKLNSKLKSNPLPGTVLNVECAMMKTFEFLEDFKVDPDSTCYTSEAKMKRLTQILRIFYILGPPTGEEICLKEFQPEMTKRPTAMGQPAFQSWPELNGQLGFWLANTSGIRVVNIQAFSARMTKRRETVDIMSDCTDEVQSSFTIREYVKILRVFYTTGSPIKSQPVVNFSSRLFLPIRTGRQMFESMSQTMFRVEAWLRLVGLPIYNVETIQYLLKESSVVGAELDKCTWSENPTVGNFFVTAIRVYFPCAFNEPDPRLLPPQQYYDSAFGPGASGCCSIS